MKNRGQTNLSAPANRSTRLGKRSGTDPPVPGFSPGANSRWAVAIFLVVYFGHALSRVATSYDSRWSIPIALSLLEHGDTNLDEYPDLLRASHYYPVECVEAGGKISNAWETGCRGGHYYDWYPVATPVLAAPFVGILKLSLAVAAPWIARLGIHPADRVTAAFLAGDLVTGAPRAEVVVSSFFVALTALLLFWIARQSLPAGQAAFLAWLFAFGTSAWSIASRGLWQHSPSMLMLTIALALFVAARKRPSLVAWSAIPIACAYTIRPLNSLAVVVVTLYVAVYYRRFLLRYLLLAAPVAAIFFWYSYAIYHRWMPTYFTQPPWAPPGPLLRGLLADLFGTLIAPSRGLLIFTPIVVFCVWGMCRAIRAGWQRPLAGWLAALAAGYWLLISLFRPIWWGGHCYGPRYFTDLMPILLFFLIPLFESWNDRGPWLRQTAAVLFLVLAGAGVFIHARGANSAEVWRWNTDPVNVNLQPRRIWDWHDPQFLRGLLPRRGRSPSQAQRVDGADRHRF